jgi:hypothetical protein
MVTEAPSGAGGRSQACRAAHLIRWEGEQIGVGDRFFDSLWVASTIAPSSVRPGGYRFPRHAGRNDPPTRPLASPCIRRG